MGDDLEPGGATGGPTDGPAGDASAAEPVAARKPVVAKGRPRARRPDLDTLFSINADGSRNAIQPADCSGRFQTRKHLLWYLLLAVYLALPWVEIGGHPAILIDIERRHFYLFGQTFNAQDFWLAFFFVSGLGFALFAVAALWGRLWCGYACPQTVFLEGVFRRLERWIEGPAAARVKLDREPMNANKLLRRGLKMVVFLAISVVITHSLLGYFMPVTDVVAAMTSPPTEHLTAFLFALVLTAIVFVNFTWFREQTCIVVCPYGRLQGALYDPDTLLVGYDRTRGEPRGPAGKDAAGKDAAGKDGACKDGAGDCVDCFRCVAVCPTGIDIRNGTQMECVGCANCIDACDDVMTKLGRPTGLVRYDSQRGFDTGQRKFLRPRVFLYAFLLVLGVSVFAFAASRRTPFEANLVRPPGPAFTVEGDRLRNLMELHLVNKLPGRAAFRIEAEAPDGVEVTIAQRAPELDSLQDLRIPVIAEQAADRFEPGQEVTLRVVGTLVDDAAGTGPQEVIARRPLLGPRRRR
ncbi:MAG: cytochrome c oxidase accessory protein CcoG [Planctomycetota bacterium]